MTIGQFENFGAMFGQRFGRAPTAAEWYLMGRHGLQGLSGMMANPQMPAWVGAYRADRGRYPTPNMAQDSVWSHMPEQFRTQRFPGGVNGMTGDSYLGTLGQTPFQGGQPNWAAALGGAATGGMRGTITNALQQNVYQPARNGLSGAGGGGSAIWPWGGGKNNNPGGANGASGGITL